MRLNETFGRKLFVCAGVLFAIGTAGLSKASAATVSWALPASGNFNTGSNWDTGLVPGALDVALFDTGSAGVMVDFSLPTTITQLGVRQDGVTFDLQGLTLSLAGASPSNSLAVGSPGSASSSATFQSSLPGGAVSTNNILIEAPALGTADMVVTGTNLTLTQAGSSTVTVGDNLGGGNASLSINDQATFNTGTGLFTVNTTGSVSLASNAVLIANGDILIDGGSIGGLRSNSNFNWAPGNTFTVQNGGSATNFSSQYDSPAGSSWVVTGVGSTLFGVGNAFDLAGTSSIAVNDGGVWTKGFSVKGSSTVTADGTGAGATLGGFDIVDGGVTLTNGATSSSFFYDIGDFVSGGLGTGTLNIQSGSTVTSNLSNGLQISSSNSDTNGVVNVTGPGSALNLISTVIGSTSSSTGALNLSSGGTYNSTGTTRVNPTGTFIIGSGGVFNASGPTLVAGGLLDVQASGVFNVDADLTVSGGTFSKDRLATMSMGAGVNMTIIDNGLAEFPDVLSNFSVNNSNTVTIDGINDGVGSPSELHAFGDLTVSGGSTVDVTNSGVLTVDDQLNVNATGLLQMGSNGVLNANGNVVVNGGAIFGLASFAPFNWAAGNTFTVQNGGVVSGFSTSYTSPANSSFVVTGAGSSVPGAGNTFILDAASSIGVSNGGSWTKNMDIVGGSTVIADGAGSTLGAFDLIDGSITLTNGAAASSSLFNVGDFGTGTGTLNVLSGSTVTSSNSFNLSLINGDSDGEVFIDGAGSSVQTFSATIGSNISGTALIDVSNGGSFVVTGTSALRATGTININGGTVLLGNAADLSGTINFNTGTFGHDGDLLIGAAGMFGANVTTGVKSYVFGGTVTLEPGASLTMDGGKLSAGSLQNFGVFTFNSGTLELTSDDLEIDFVGLLGRTPTIAAGQDVIVTNSINIVSVGLLTMNGGSVSAGILNNGGVIQMNSLAALIGGGTIVNSGTLSGTGLIDSTLSNSGLIDNLVGALQFNGDLTNNAGGVIASRGQLRLLGGLTNDGNLSLGAGINDVFGNIANSATGQVSVADGSTTSFFGTMANAGDVFVGFDSRAIFFNAASGAGSFSGTGVVEFAAGFSPGASPAIVSFGGDMVLAGTANLLIELGGLTAGTGFDQLAVAGDVTLSGTLDVTDLKGFVLSPGMAFDLVTFGGSLTGAFGNVVNSTGLSGLLLSVSSDADSVNLLLDGLAGDLNLDGFVGVDDLNIVLLNWNQSVSTGIWQFGDPTGDGFVGVDDLNVVLVNWNNGTPPVVAAIPEPAGLLVWGVLSVGLVRRGRRGGLV